MSIGIRFTGTTDAAIPTPPTGKAWLYYDDTLKVYKAKLDDGSIVILNVSAEVVQDIIFNTISSSSGTIVINYDDPGNILYLEIANNSITTAHVNSISPIKIKDANNDRVQGTVTTTDTSLTQIASYSPPADGMYTITYTITGYRTGGLSGPIGGGISIIRTLRLRRHSGALTVFDVQSDYTSKDAYGFGHNISGTDINFYVIGGANQTVKWAFKADIHYVTV